MKKNIRYAILLLLITGLSNAQSLISISPDKGVTLQTLSTTITGSDFFFSTASSTLIPSNLYLQLGASVLLPNFITAIDDDHINANWTLNASMPLGNYDLVYLYQGPLGNQSILPGVFNIYNACKVIVTPASDTATCTKDSVKLSYSTATSYQWTLNGTSISGATQQVYYAKTTGIYKVYTTGGTCPGFSNGISITIGSATISPSVTQNICTGQTATFTANTGSGLTYQWKKNGVLLAGSTGSTLAVSDSGNYKCTVTNSIGCTKTSKIVKVNIASLPVVTFTTQPGPTAGKDAFLLSYNPTTNYGNSTELDAFAWTINNVNANARGLFQFDLSNIPTGSVISSASLNLYFDSATTYTGHQQSGTNSSYIRRVTSPWTESTVTWTNQPTNTTVNQVSIPASSTPYQDFTNIDVTTLIRSMVNDPATNYGLLLRLASEVKFSSLLFCSSDHPNSSRRPKLLIKYVAATINASNGSAFCSGDSSVLSGNAGLYSYEWSKNGSLINGATNVKYTAKTSGTYTLKITNSFGCSLVSTSKTLTAYNLPNATITPDGPTSFCNGDSVVLQANAGTNLLYSWKKDNITINGATTINYSAKAAGNYKVKTTNSNGCTKLSPVTTVTVPCRTEETTTVSDKFRVEVYPNPSSGDFTFKVLSPSNDFVLIRIFDLTGRLIFNKTCLNSCEVLSAMIETPGIYKAEVIQGSNIKVLSLIKTE